MKDISFIYDRFIKCKSVKIKYIFLDKEFIFKFDDDNNDYILNCFDVAQLMYIKSLNKSNEYFINCLYKGMNQLVDIVKLESSKREEDIKQLNDDFEAIQDILE